MNAQQAQWAQKHDWHVKTTQEEENGEYWVIARDWVQDEYTGHYQPINKLFTDYADLRAWAGY